MANANAVYSRAVNTLKPSRARMAAIHAASVALNEEAKAVIRQLIAKGWTAKELYEISNSNRIEGEKPIAKEIRVVLLGMVRRGVKI